MRTFSNGPLGTSGEWRRRLRLQYGPLALVSVVVLVLFMTLPAFDVSKYLPGDLFSGTFPRDYDDANAQAQHAAGQAPEQEGADHSERFGGQPPQQQGGGHQPPQEQDGGESVAQSGDEGARSRDFLGLNTRRFTVASGYVATGLLALTLVIGPANLLFRRRRPPSSPGSDRSRERSSKTSASRFPGSAPASPSAGWLGRYATTSTSSRNGTASACASKPTAGPGNYHRSPRCRSSGSSRRHSPTSANTPPRARRWLRSPHSSPASSRSSSPTTGGAS